MTLLITKKIRIIATEHSSYQVGLVQAKAYRILRQHTAKILAACCKLSPLDWALLGILVVRKKSRPTILASELGVEAPLVTKIIANLQRRNLLETKPDPKDSRAIIVHLTSEGRNFIRKNEPYVRKEMKPLLSGLSIKDLATYLAVLEKIVENSRLVR